MEQSNAKTSIIPVENKDEKVKESEKSEKTENSDDNISKPNSNMRI